MTKHGGLRRIFRRDYLAAVLFWALARLARLQVHRVVIVRVDRRPAARASRTDFSLLGIHDPESLDRLGADLESQIDEESGIGCRTLIARGNSVFVALDQGAVACQLTVYRGEVVVDSPTDLRFSLAPGASFFGYMHTRDRFRGRGLASSLIEFARASEMDSGATSCLAHIRATNHASMTTFRRAGWQPEAWLLTSRTGSLLGAPGCQRIGLRVSPLAKTS